MLYIGYNDLTITSLGSQILMKMLIKYCYLFMTQKTVETDIKYCTRRKTFS